MLYRLCTIVVTREAPWQFSAEGLRTNLKYDLIKWDCIFLGALNRPRERCLSMRFCKYHMCTKSVRPLSRAERLQHLLKESRRYLESTDGMARSQGKAPILPLCPSPTVAWVHQDLPTSGDA
jgi:hypothetical protein